MSRGALHNKSKAMGTNVYMRRIPTAAQKEELKRLLKKQHEEAIESIDRDEDLRPAAFLSPATSTSPRQASAFQGTRIFC